MKIWCEKCNGSGTGWDKPCKFCKGEGCTEEKVQDWYTDIKSFMTVMGQEINNRPTIPFLKTQKLHRELVDEEINKELMPALLSDDLINIADGIVDSIVVILDVAVAYGIDIRPIWDMVHEANMRKINGPIREDGKRLKPEGWKHPDIKVELERQKKEIR